MRHARRLLTVLRQISCGQVNVENGGSGTPGPLVAIPGVYTGYEPGILININVSPLPSSPWKSSQADIGLSSTPSPRTTLSPAPLSGLGEKRVLLSVCSVCLCSNYRYSISNFLQLAACTKTGHKLRLNVTSLPTSERTYRKFADHTPAPHARCEQRHWHYRGVSLSMSSRHVNMVDKKRVHSRARKRRSGVRAYEGAGRDIEKARVISY